MNREGKTGTRDEEGKKKKEKFLPKKYTEFLDRKNQ